MSNHSDDAERSADLAGTWYPDTAAQCERSFEAFARDAVRYRGSGPLRGAVVPHAGWTFSGGIAHNTLAELARLSGEIDTVVLFAGHLGPGAAPTVMTAGRCWTPLGAIETDEELARAVAEACAGVVRPEGPRDHTQDNSFEVQFPLLRHAFGSARMVAVGAPPRGESLAVADALLDTASRLGRRLAVVGSTDLSHYGPNYGWTPQGTGQQAERWVREDNDPLFIDAVIQLDPRPMIDVALERRNACCPGAAAAAAHCARRLGSPGGSLLRYGTSADIHRSSSFVGYAGILF